ncbi:hypothetical protein C4J93_2145 [Pseudomonas sp. R2-37-08W]|nr:hypothetical protein C4J93_2145 [Pseudomonas sp. R2-37-08W]
MGGEIPANAKYAAGRHARRADTPGGIWKCRFSKRQRMEKLP